MAETEKGALITPTIIDQVTPEMEVVCQEIFGPVITILTYEDLDQAIDESNGYTLWTSICNFHNQY